MCVYVVAGVVAVFEARELAVVFGVDALLLFAGVAVAAVAALAGDVFCLAESVRG